jgi:hypothetical protein
LYMYRKMQSVELYGKLPIKGGLTNFSLKQRREKPLNAIVYSLVKRMPDYN